MNQDDDFECEGMDCAGCDNCTWKPTPPAPPFAPTFEELSSALKGVFDKYPAMRINMPALVNMMMQVLNPNPATFRQAEKVIRKFVQDLADLGTLNITKGKTGGVIRTSDYLGFPKVAALLHSAKVEPTQAINDHTCPHCGNTSCSKSERSCWKCGGSLH